MAKKVLENVVIGKVQSLNYSPPKDGYKNGSVFVRLEGNVLLIGNGVQAEDMPAVGSFSAFRCSASRSGKSAIVNAWGWVSATGSGSQNKDGILSVNWIKNFDSVSVSSGVGVSE